MKFGISVLFENISRKFKFYQNVARITGPLHGDKYAFLIISLQIFFRMRNISDKICTGNQYTILCSITFFFVENRDAYKVTYKNTVKPGRSQMIIWRMGMACWIPKSKNTNS